MRAPTNRQLLATVVLASLVNVPICLMALFDQGSDRDLLRSLDVTCGSLRQDLTALVRTTDRHEASSETHRATLSVVNQRLEALETSMRLASESAKDRKPLEMSSDVLAVRLSAVEIATMNQAALLSKLQSETSRWSRELATLRKQVDSLLPPR